MAAKRLYKRPHVEDPVLAKALQQIDDEFSNLFRAVAVAGAGGGVVPTGTGFRHVTAGAEDAASKTVVDADVAPGAAIGVAKLAPGAEGQILEMGAALPGWGRKITISASDPSGGNNGDLWLKYVV